MQYALIEGSRALPAPRAKAECPACSAPVIAKCGTRVVWHWAHAAGRHCDPWWENETDWHRTWKSQVPEAWREVVMFDDRSGEKHIADIRTDTGFVIELQHSAMTPEELRSREQFYERMIWIVDARPFAASFVVLNDPLPHPDSKLHSDVVFFPELASAFWRLSERDRTSALVQMHHAREIAEEIQADYRGHHFFKWTRPRQVWLEATAPVFLDFGEQELLQLHRFGQFKQLCVQRRPRRLPSETEVMSVLRPDA